MDGEDAEEMLLDDDDHEADAGGEDEDDDDDRDEDDDDHHQDEEEEAPTAGDRAVPTQWVDIVAQALAARQDMYDRQMPSLASLRDRYDMERAAVKREIETMNVMLIHATTEVKHLRAEVKRLTALLPASAPPPSSSLLGRDIPSPYEATEAIERHHRASVACDAVMEEWSRAMEETNANLELTILNATINEVTRQQAQTTPVLTHAAYHTPTVVSLDTAIESASLPSNPKEIRLKNMPFNMFYA
jgi:hypothetical protein